MEQKWKILSSAAGAGASATSFVEEEEEKEKSRWKPAPCVLLSKSSSSSVRARLDPKEGKRRQKYINLRKKMQIGARCKTRIPGRTWRGSRTQKEEDGEGFFFFSSSFLWRSPTKKPTLANQSGGVALLLLSPGSRRNQTNGDRATHARTKQQAAFCSAPLCDCATSRTTGYGKYSAQWRSH